MTFSGIDAVGSAGSGPGGHGGNVTQLQLSDLAGELSGLDIGAGAGHVVSPAALFGETLERMRGFLKRADAMSRSTPLQPSESQSAGLHAGPAVANLESAVWSPGSSAPQGGGAVRFDEIAQHVLDSMRFVLEADLVSKTSSQVGKSMNTLVKGQ